MPQQVQLILTDFELHNVSFSMNILFSVFHVIYTVKAICVVSITQQNAKNRLLIYLQYIY